MEDRIERVYCHSVVADMDDMPAKKTFAEIVAKDSGDRSFGFSSDVLSMLCLDLDAIESLRSGDNEKTMDCSVGIGRYNVTQRVFAGRMLLLVELKLNCVNHTLGASHYIGKVRHTRDLLADRNIHGSHIFLFTGQVKGKAQRDVFGWSRGSNGNVLKTIRIMTPVEFNGYVGFESQYPYKPINDGQTMAAEIAGAAVDAVSLAEVIEKWKQKGIAYRHAGNMPEACHISHTVKSAAAAVVDNMEPGVDREYIQLILDEL